jgi:hypothetical protein
MIHEQNELVKPSGRYVQLPDCILKDMDNAGADGLVTVGIYISIANAAFNHMVNKITAETIGKNVHRSERTAQRHIKRLVERGRIEIVEANGKVLTIKDLAGMENDRVRTAKKLDTGVQEHDTSVADTHVASPVTTPMSQARDTSVAENPLVVEHEKAAPPSLTSTSFMHEEQLAIKQLSMSASNSNSRSASNSEDMNSCNSRHEREVSEKLEEDEDDDLFKSCKSNGMSASNSRQQEKEFDNFGEHELDSNSIQDGMRDVLTHVYTNQHIPNTHIPDSVKQDGTGASLRESISHSSMSHSPNSLRDSVEPAYDFAKELREQDALNDLEDLNTRALVLTHSGRTENREIPETPKRRIKQWEKWRSE